MSLRHTRPILGRLGRINQEGTFLDAGLAVCLGVFQVGWQVREFVTTLDTVKKHVSHVLGKLGVANRTEAVARARWLSLIP